MIRMGKAGGNGAAAAPRDPVGGFHRRAEPAISNAKSTPPPVSGADFLDRIGLSGIHRGSRAERLRERQLGLVRSIATTSLAPLATAAISAEPDPAEAEHGRARPRLQARRIDDCAHARQDGTTEQAPLRQAQAGFDLHAGAPRHDRMLREAGHAHVMVHRLPGDAEPPFAGEQRARRVGGGARLAKGGAAFGARARNRRSWARTPARHDRRASGPARRGRIPPRWPEDSWPRTIGSGRGRSPLITDRSEWQSPAAPIFTSTFATGLMMACTPPVIRGCRART